MRLSPEKNVRCCLLVAVYCYLALHMFGAICEVKACKQSIQEQPIVFLSVNVVNNSLQVYWENVDYEKYYLVLAGHGKVINFYKRGAIFEFWDNGKQYVLDTIKPTNSSGFVQTGVPFTRSKLGTVDSAGNLGYYVHLTTPAGIVVKTFCMQGHPTWMNDYRSQIGNISLTQLFIPGTYQSAGYMTEEIASNFEVQHKYSITQGWEDILSQLRLGARYLDIRIAEYVTSDIRYWTVHNLTKMHPLRYILEQVRKFVEETNEIVIFDIHAFQKGFDYVSDYVKLVEFIRSEIEDLMVSPSIGWQGTLNQIWATDKRIIVGFANANMVNKFSEHLWSTTSFRIEYTDDKNKVKEYLYSKQFERRGNIPRTDIAALSPTPNTIVADSISHVFKTIISNLRNNPLGNSEHSDALSPGRKHRAQGMNHEVTLWYLHDLGRTCNIVAVDYILSTNIVDVAIYWNLRKSQQRR